MIVGLGAKNCDLELLLWLLKRPKNQIDAPSGCAREEDRFVRAQELAQSTGVRWVFRLVAHTDALSVRMSTWLRENSRGSERARSLDRRPADSRSLCPGVSRDRRDVELNNQTSKWSAIHGQGRVDHQQGRKDLGQGRRLSWQGKAQNETETRYIKVGSVETCTQNRALKRPVAAASAIEAPLTGKLGSK